MADCSRTMPEQLLEDRIIYKGAGSSFLTSDYAHMDEYQDWLKTQRQKANGATAGKDSIESSR